MSAKSELFVTEVIRDILEKEYPDLRFDEIEVPEDWEDLWEDAEFPNEGEANVLLDNEIIGTVTWEMEFMVESDPTHRLERKYIVAEPVNVEFHQIEEEI